MAMDQYYEDYWLLYSMMGFSEEDDVGCKEDDVGCCPLPGSFGCATQCYFFFRKLIEVIEVKKVLKGLRSPLFGVHG
ncbi:unnamed protein product [Caenorhabditis nigoni]